MNLRLRRLLTLAVFAAMLPLPAAAAPPAADAASVALRSGNASNAVALATQALADPSLLPRDRARVLVDRGLAHEALGEHDAALLDFTEAINAHVLTGADLARAFYNRGVALDALGQTDDAIGDYAATLRIEPRHAAALNNRGNAYRRIGRLSEASADYKASLAAGNPHPEYPNYGLGLIAEAQGNPALARTYYQAALTASPQFSLAAERLTALSIPPSSSQPAPTPPDTTGDLTTPLQPYVPPQGSDDGPIVLHKPGTRPVSGAPVAAEDDDVIHLRPPAERVHLRPPKPRVAAPAPAAAAPPPQLKPALGDNVGSASRTIQLGAWRNEADAADAWNRIVSVAGTLMAGLSPQVVPVELPGKGRYYRLRAGPVYDDVNQLCAALRAHKLECFPVKD